MRSLIALVCLTTLAWVITLAWFPEWSGWALVAEFVVVLSGFGYSLYEGDGS